MKRTGLFIHPHVGFCLVGPDLEPGDVDDDARAALADTLPYFLDHCGPNMMGFLLVRSDGSVGVAISTVKEFRDFLHARGQTIVEVEMVAPEELLIAVRTPHDDYMHICHRPGRG